MSLFSNDNLLLSISRAGRFKRCRRSFYYRYVSNLVEVQSRESALGDFFHSTLDFWAGFYIKKIDLRDSMKMAYTSALQKRTTEENKILLTKEDLQTVKQWLKEYVLFIEKDPPIVLEHEKPFDFLIDNKYLVRGAIDRVDRLDKNTIRIVDYKVGNSQYIDSKQVSVYAKALIDNPLYKGKRFIGGYVFLKEDCRVVEYEITEDLINNALQYLKDIGEKITTEKVWKPTFGPLCGWCSYKFQCAKDNNSSGELICL